MSHKLFRAETRSERQLVALLPLLAAVIFGLFAAGFWSTVVSGVLVVMSMGIAFSSQWELVGESQAMERSLRDFLMGLILVCLSRWYLLVFPQNGSWEFIAVAALLFSRVGPFSAAATQELLSQGYSWRRLTLEWMPRLTGSALVVLVLFESGMLQSGRGSLMVIAAVGLLLSLLTGLASSGGARTSASVLSALGIWGIVLACSVEVSHFKVLYLWMFLSGWSVLSLQDLVRVPAGERARTTAQGTFWVRGALMLLVGVLIGAPGWMSGTLVLSVFQFGLSDIAAQIGLSLGYLAFVLLALVWATRVWREARSHTALSASLALPLMTSGLLLALAWDGTMTGGWFEDGGLQLDQIAAPFFSGQFGLSLSTVSLDARGWVAAGLLIAILICAIAMRGGQDRPSQLRTQLPALFRVVDQGLGTERLADRLWTAVARGGSEMNAFWSGVILERGVYRSLHLAANWVSRRIHAVGIQSDQRLSGFFRSFFRAPALMTQAFQDGDLRWYLFWGILAFGLMLLRQGWFVK